MKFDWIIEDRDVEAVKKVLKQCDQDFLNQRKIKNVKGNGVVLTKDSIIHAMILCLLTTQQKSGKGSAVYNFLDTTPFPITNSKLKEANDISILIQEILSTAKLHRFIKRISAFFSYNFSLFENDSWNIINELKLLENTKDKAMERQIADEIHDQFKGLGPKQSRNFLQYLGLTKHEIPIDSRVTRWLNQEQIFPIKIKASPLSNKEYYHFILDGIQELCIKANTYPCLLDAAVFSMADIKRNMKNRG